MQGPSQDSAADRVQKSHVAGLSKRIIECLGVSGGRDGLAPVVLQPKCGSSTPSWPPPPGAPRQGHPQSAALGPRRRTEPAGSRCSALPLRRPGRQGRREGSPSEPSLESPGNRGLHRMAQSTCVTAPVGDVRGGHTCRPMDTSPLTPALVYNFCHQEDYIGARC